jgi:hypothetical protein
VAAVGCFVGKAEGEVVGLALGATDQAARYVGASDGAPVGATVGALVVGAIIVAFECWMKRRRRETEKGILRSITACITAAFRAGA